jgi:hypothetical protein
MRRLSIRMHLPLCFAAAICACWTMAANFALGEDSGKPEKLNSEIERCKHIGDERARSRCIQEANQPGNASAQQPAEAGTWQLTRTPNPAGGPDTISITKMTNTTPSEQNITGLMLRCAEGATTDVLVVLMEPLPPRTHPKVTVAAGATTTEFIGSVVTPGALVLLPEKASALIEHDWQSVPELAVSIVEAHHSLHGVIPLTDIAAAMRTLQSNCPKAVRAR